MWNFWQLFLTVSASIVMWLIRNWKCIIYACAKFLEGEQTMAAEIIEIIDIVVVVYYSGRNYIVYILLK